MIDFLKARLPQWRPHHQCADTAPNPFYFEKFSGVACLVSRGGPALAFYYISPPALQIFRSSYGPSLSKVKAPTVYRATKAKRLLYGIMTLFHIQTKAKAPIS